MGALQDQKGVVKEREEELANLNMQLEDSRGQASHLERALDETKAQTNALEMQIEATEDRLRSQANDHQQQVKERVIYFNLYNVQSGPKVYFHL